MRFLYPIVRLFGNNSSITSSELAEAMVFVGLKGFENNILENIDIYKSAQRNA